MLGKIYTNMSVLAVLCVAFLAPTAADAGATKLTLINGWKDYGFGTGKPAITAFKGVAYFSGAMNTSGSNDQPFVLPPQFRPPSLVYTKIDLCDAHNGRLAISSDGTVHVQVEGEDFTQAQCFTSLEGVSFALSSDGFKLLKLQHGWETYGTTTPAANSSSGTVTLEGAMSTSQGHTAAFRLPKNLRPDAILYVPADMTSATNGRLNISPDGTVAVQGENGNGNAFGFTSLDGISFATDSTGFTPVTLMNGWEQDGTRNAAVRLTGKRVQFEGAIINGTNAAAFVLPSNMRPSQTVYIPVDLCEANNGRLEIGTDGTVFVQAENNFSDAQCLTSLEGVWFLQ